MITPDPYVPSADAPPPPSGPPRRPRATPGQRPGEASKARLIAGAVILGVVVLFALASFVRSAVDAGAIRGLVLRASGEIEPQPVHEVTGVAYPYTMGFPGDHWHLRMAAAARKDQPLADRWIIRPDKDAHIITIVERVPGKVLPVDAYADAVIEAQKKASTAFELVDRLPLQSDPEGGRVMHTRFTTQGTAFERLAAVVAVGERGFQIIATVERPRFAAMAAELRQIVESFRIPADAVQLSPESELEPSPVHEVTGVAYPYTLKAPGRRWYLRKAEAAKKDQPLADHWLTRPDKGAHVIVIAEHAPGAKVDIDPYTDEVLAGVRTRTTAFELIKREPLKNDPVHGRLLRTTTTIGTTQLDYLYGVIAVGDRGFQVIGFAEHPGFPAVEAEIMGIIDSFQLPPK